MVNKMGQRECFMELRYYCIFYCLGTTRRVWYVPIVMLLRKSSSEMDVDSLVLSRQQLDVFPKAYLSILELTQRGDLNGLVTIDDSCHVRFRLDGPRP